MRFSWKMNKEKFNYYQNQIDCLTNPGAYKYKIQIRSGANDDSTTWMNISKEQLKKIREILELEE